jgi:hypothetical protein
MVILNSISEPFLLILCGLRWFIPIILFVFIYDVVDIELVAHVYKAMKVVFVIHVSLQVYELLYMSPMYGSTFGGFAARVPGLMSLSHAAALFTCIFYMLLEKFERARWGKKIMTILVFLSIIMVMSSTGVCVLGLLYLLGRYGNSLNNTKALYVFLPVVVMALYMYADNITGREYGSSQMSLGTRVALGIDMFENAGIVSNKFGCVTNGAIIMQQEGLLKETDFQWGDSFYNSVIGNLGIMAFLILILCIVKTVLFSIIHNYTYLLRWVLLFAFCSVSTIITEIFPASLIIGVIAAFFVKSINEKSYCYLV